MYILFAFLLILILVVIYLNPIFCKEYFLIPVNYNFIPLNTYKYPLYSQNINGYYIPWSNGYTNLPWWNTSLGNTTNMSYDLRGDPLIIPRTNFVWNNGTNFPIYN